MGFSNARHNPTWVYKNPLDNLPEPVRQGVEDALRQSLNAQSRKTKRRRLGFSTSEDAITWTVFAWLARHERKALQALAGRLFQLVDVQEPSLLLWGVPVPPSSLGENIKERRVQVLDTLGEDPRRRSEPDVVLDYGASGSVFIEVKWRAANDVLPKSLHGKFSRYLNATSAFSAPLVARDSGFYELVRNWRIGWDLAAGRPFRLVNLGPPSLFQDPTLDTLRMSLSLDSDARFLMLTWNELLADLERVRGPLPPWLRTWLNERRLQ